MLRLLAHGSITVGPDLQPVFQTLLLARGETGTSVFKHLLCGVLDLAPGDTWRYKAEERGWFLCHSYQLTSEQRISLFP